jgi:hypothetical protein
VLSDTIVFRLKFNEDGSVTGGDSVIARAPEQAYKVIDGKAVPDVALVIKLLTDISLDSAAAMGEKLHHGDWVLTNNPEAVRDIGTMHDCPSCVAQTDQALAAMNEFPDMYVFAGILYWTEAGA